MPDTANPATLDTAHPEIRREQLENAWRRWRAGEEPPHWEQFLPASGEPCHPDLIFSLIQVDIDFHVQAGLSALLSERYFEHPRLQEMDARLSAGRQVELIRGEYQQRWQNGQRARRSDYQTAFPQHADDLDKLRPSWCCPRCRQAITLEEEIETLHCPSCDPRPR
jgi:hypothetical protein